MEKDIALVLILLSIMKIIFVLVKILEKMLKVENIVIAVYI